MTQDNRYARDITIPCYDTDASFRLKPASFMDLAQELAYWAAQQLGFGYDDLQRHHTAWVLSRMHFIFHDPPRWRDEVTLHTWHKGQDGVFFLRDFELRRKGDTHMEDKSGVLVSCTTSWIVMDTRSRRLVRSEEVLQMIPGDTQCPDDAIRGHCPKIVPPKGIPAQPAGERTVSYSDIDIIGHTNNARYLLWAMDGMDYAKATERAVKEVRINFNKETVAGEKVQLFRQEVRSPEGNPTYYIEGRADGKSCFCIQLDY